MCDEFSRAELFLRPAPNLLVTHQLSTFELMNFKIPMENLFLISNWNWIWFPWRSCGLKECTTSIQNIAEHKKITASNMFWHMLLSQKLRIKFPDFTNIRGFILFIHVAKLFTESLRISTQPSLAPPIIHKRSFPLNRSEVDPHTRQLSAKITQMLIESFFTTESTLGNISAKRNRLRTDAIKVKMFTSNLWTSKG